MRVLKTTFHGNPNIGLYAFATDSYCLISPNVQKKTIDKIKKVLKTPIHKITIAGTDLIGALCTGNKDLLLIPEITRPEEIKQLEKLKIKYKIIKTKLTALGNNILIRDNICLVNPDFDNQTIKQLEKLKLKPTKGKIAKIPTIGSCSIITKKGCLIHRDASESEINKIEKLFKLDLDIGTVNMGNPYVHSGIIANSNGYIIGGLTSGYEIVRIESALGYQNG